MNIKVIKNKEEYEKALNHLSKLMDLNPALGSKEESELELMILVIMDYEQKVCDPIFPDPTNRAPAKS